MNLSEMRATVRRDLHDEDETSYRWSDDELDRHIGRAVKELSIAIPSEQKAARATTAGSREIDISDLSQRIIVLAVEYPVDKLPRRCQRYSLWADTLNLLGEEMPDGSDAYIYYGKLHSLDGTGSTIPAHLEDVIAGGASGYAAAEWAIFATNRINIGGGGTPQAYSEWGRERLRQFKQELKRLGRRNKVRMNQLYTPHLAITSKTTDSGP